MSAMIKEIAAWVFGFFTLPVIIGGIALVIWGITEWFELRKWFDLSVEYAFGGGIVFVAAFLIAIAIAIKFITP